MKKMISLPAVVFAILFPLLSFASNVYYPTQFQEQVVRHELHDQALKDELFTILASAHTRQAKGDDILGCDQNKGKCFSHTALGYGPARKYLYTQLHVQTDSRGSFVKEVYCNREQMIPINESSINCEHTWPQSKFTKAFNNELQKSDMHHLFPADIKANSARGNFDFAEVVSNLNLKNCDASKSGASVVAGGKTYFEPPVEHRGNVARALFYFSVRYKMAMSQDQQTFLKKWNEQDPVDDAEMARNDAIEKLQGSRNPFIDFPNLAQDISKF
ncbi:MAG: endonuclease [Bacteriovorax sp.]|nr:endonuclease [Bacteriovorax sp.]